MLIPTIYVHSGETTVPVACGYLFGVSGDAYGQNALVKIENGEIKQGQIGMIKREDKTLYVKKVLGITGERSWVCTPVWSIPGDYDHTQKAIGSHYIMLNVASPGTYHITIPTDNPSLEVSMPGGIQMTLEAPAAGIYMFEDPYDFNGLETLYGIRPAVQGPMESVMYGIMGFAAQYKQVPATPGEYTDEGLYVVKIPNSQAINKTSTNSVTDLQIFGKAPVGATEINLSTYDGNLDKASLSSSVLMNTTDIKSDRLFWIKREDVGLTDVINNAHESGYCAVVWCEAPAGGEFYAQAVIHYTCLSGDTLITMADGSVKRLDMLSVGEFVLSQNNTPTMIVKLERGGFNGYHTLYGFDDGTVIDETHEHRFYNVEHNTLTKLRDWKIGEHARKQDSSTTALLTVQLVNEPAEMFGIWTEGGYYWANGLLSGEAAAVVKEQLSGDGLAKFVGSIPADKLQYLIGDLGWFE